MLTNSLRAVRCPSHFPCLSPYSESSYPQPPPDPRLVHLLLVTPHPWVWIVPFYLGLARSIHRICHIDIPHPLPFRPAERVHCALCNVDKSKHIDDPQHSRPLRPVNLVRDPKMFLSEVLGTPN